MKKKQGKKNQYLFFGIFIVIVILVLTLTGNYYRGKRGFVINGNRIGISTRVETNTLFIDLEKQIDRSNAYKGIVIIKVTPQVPKGIDAQHGFDVPVWSYEFVFSDAKKEMFTIQCPYGRGVNYIVQFQVGTVRESRVVFHATF